MAESPMSVDGAAKVRVLEVRPVGPTAALDSSVDPRRPRCLALDMVASDVVTPHLRPAEGPLEPLVLSGGGGTNPLVTAEFSC